MPPLERLNLCLICLVLLFPARFLAAQQAGDAVWLYPATGAVTASPTLDNIGNVLFGSEDSLAYSLTPGGNINWAFKTNDFITGDMAYSPLGYAVFGSWDGFIHAVNPDGSSRWSYNAQAFITASPAVSLRGMIYIGARDGIFYALRPDGTVEWFHIANAPIESGAAIASDGTIYYGDESGTLFALNPDGSLKWEFAADVVTGRDSRIRTTPAIDRDGTLYFGSGNHFFYALSPDGTLKWKFETRDKNDSSAAIDGDGQIIFASRDGSLYKLEPAQGNTVWTRQVGDVFYCSPAVDTENNVYIAGFIGGGITRLYALDKDGNELWSRNYNALNDASPLLTEDGHLYIAFHDGLVHKIYSGHGPANSAWPMKARNAARTANMDEVFATAERVDEWIVSDWFGWLRRISGSWFYHAEHRWIYGPSRDPDSYWFYDFALGQWVWTARAAYPYLYVSAQGWLYYLQPSVSPERWFYHYTINDWFTEPELKAVLQAP